jgi:hypothetical protein
MEEDFLSNSQDTNLIVINTKDGMNKIYREIWLNVDINPNDFQNHEAFCSIHEKF